MDRDDSNLKWKHLHTEHLIQDQWIDLRATSYQMPDGNVYEPYYTFRRKDYVVIVASDTEGRYLTVRQFRQGCRCVTTEFPAGCIEPEKEERKAEADMEMPAAPCSEEAALMAAKRELQEETGYTCEDWEHILTLPAEATVSEDFVHLYRAKNCRKVSGQTLDDMEFLHVELHTAEEIDQLIRKGRFQQISHVAAWRLL